MTVASFIVTIDRGACQPPRTDGGVALCPASSKTGSCRLGLTTERLDGDGITPLRHLLPAGARGRPGVAHGAWTAAVLDEVLGHVPLLNGQMTVRER
jgi:hypothetical protein